MAEICPDCGLPKDLCVCDTIAKEEEKITVSVDRRRYGKEVTVINNISKDMNPEEVAKKLKKQMACGGTYKDGKIELQGNHIRKVKDALVEMGFPEDQIQVRK
ncbi:MAG: translation initiation factor [Candidatus Aenigmatarchaeota archaeon]